MQKIILNVKEELFATLERDFNTFVRLSTKLDAQFYTPSFEKFLLAKLSDNVTPLTEQAVQHLMQSSQYAWAKRALDKDFPEVVSLLMTQAAEHGFHVAHRQDWNTEDLTTAAKTWATSLVKQAKGDETQIDVLAVQIRSSAVSIVEIEEKLRTPAWRLGNALAQNLHDVIIAMDHATGIKAREKFGELRAVLRLSVIHGAIGKKREQEILDDLRSKKPYLFEDQPQTGFARFMLWLRNAMAV
ncbi:DUF4088 family protein [Oxalobacteraceae bacterium CAVE-383]|nr:DUF4088 family protein [Oxalobacteraceae bacterium CAVE-383]